MRSRCKGRTGEYDFFVGQKVIIVDHPWYNGLEAVIDKLEDDPYGDEEDAGAYIRVFALGKPLERLFLFLYRLKPVEEEESFDLGEYEDY